MRRTFVKLFGVALALCLLLTGCNLIKVDQIMQIQEDTQKLDKAQVKPVVEYDGGTITLGDVAYDYAYNYSYMSQMYSIYGLSMTDSVVANLKQSVMETAMNTRATMLKAEELGISLTDEEEEECKTNTESTYQESYDEYLTTYADGETDEIKAAQTEYALKASGITKETILEGQRATKIIDKVEEKVRGEVTEATEDQLKKIYEEKVAKDEDTYETAPENLASDMMDEANDPYWFPSGYRTVKHILLKGDEGALAEYTAKKDAAAAIETEISTLNDELAALDKAEDAESKDAEAEAEAATERTKADVEADIADAQKRLEDANAETEAAKANVLAAVQTQLDDIYKRLEAGEDFATLIAEYGEDPGMQNEPTATRGYYVAADNTNWDAAFQAAALALEKVGDVSDPVIGKSGVHIIRYEGEVKVGEVGFETVKDRMYDSALETLKDDHYEEQLKSWVAALNPVYHVETFGQ